MRGCPEETIDSGVVRVRTPTLERVREGREDHDELPVFDDWRSWTLRTIVLLSRRRYGRQNPWTAEAGFLAAGASPPQTGCGNHANTQHLQEIIPMKSAFKVGDHVSWNSEAGHVRGTIKKKVTSALKFKTYTVRASKKEPQYLIKSDKTDHMAMHKGSALKKITKSKRGST